MAESRKRRIVRRAVIALAVVVLLLSGYVSAYFGMSWLRGRRVVSPNQAKTIRTTVFAPFHAYKQDEDAPGSRTFRLLELWCMNHGNGSPCSWKELEERMTQEEHEKRKFLLWNGRRPSTAPPEKQ